MRIVELGISLYPEQETLQEMEAYIKLASQYGFTRIFTSMFSVPGEKEEVLSCFQKLCSMAHVHQMEVCIDANAQMFDRFGATEHDISVFKQIGVDEIRMDFCYGDERDVILVNNKEGIKIQFSAFMIQAVQPVIERLNGKEVTLCHNFYPERYTGVPKKEYRRINEIWKKYPVKIGAFITSNVEKAHGPWPVYDGLPTIEDHRKRSISYQVREFLAMGDTDILYFGNAFASEAELKEAMQTLKQQDVVEEKTEFEKMVEAVIPNVGKKRVVLQIDTKQDINDIESKILYQFKKHCDLGDSSDYMLRSRITRTLYGKESIPYRKITKPYFTKGDVMIVNDNLKHYCGELQICLKDMENDGQRNLVGHLNEDEMQLLDYITPGTYFSFIK